MANDWVCFVQYKLQNPPEYFLKFDLGKTSFAEHSTQLKVELTC